MATKFAELNRTVFERALEYHFFWVHAPRWCYSHEWQLTQPTLRWRLGVRDGRIYELLYIVLLTDDMAVRICSSIFKYSGTFREVGADRIHLQLVRASTLEPLGPTRRMNRVRTSRTVVSTRLRQKIESMLIDIGYFDGRKCKHCRGRYMMRTTRKSRYVFICENTGKKPGPHGHPVGLKGKMVQPRDVGRVVQK